MKYSRGTLSDFIEFNPRESLPKGNVAKEIAMADLIPFQKKISNYNISPYKGGMKFRNGDILLARIAPCLENGKTAYVDILNEDEVGFGSTEYIVLRAIPQKTIPEFVFYFAISDWFRKRAIALMTGSSGRQRVQTDKLMDLEVIMPDLETQRKIVHILSALDQKIESNCKQNDLLFSIAESKFEQIYSSGTRRRLGSILFNIESGSRPKGGAEEFGIPSIGAEKIEKFGIYDYSSEKYIGENYYSNMKRGVLKDKDVLLYKDGAYTGKSSMCLSGFPHTKAAVNEHVFILNTKDNYAQFYLYFCINKKENQEMLHRMASSKAAQPGLNQSEVRSLEVNIVSDADIEKFESGISPFMEKIANNTLQNKTLSGLRDAFLPKLMSDEVNLDEVTIDE